MSKEISFRGLERRIGQVIVATFQIYGKRSGRLIRDIENKLCIETKCERFYFSGGETVALPVLDFRWDTLREYKLMNTAENKKEIISKY